MPNVSGISLCLSMFASKPKTTTTIPWILDTGAPDHMICDISLFTNIVAQVSHLVTLPDGNGAAVTHIGTCKFQKN